jgi:hypothetical protein
MIRTSGELGMCSSLSSQFQQQWPASAPRLVPYQRTLVTRKHPTVPATATQVVAAASTTPCDSQLAVARRSHLRGCSMRSAQSRLHWPEQHLSNAPARSCNSQSTQSQIVPREMELPSSHAPVLRTRFSVPCNASTPNAPHPPTLQSGQHHALLALEAAKPLLQMQSQPPERAVAHHPFAEIALLNPELSLFHLNSWNPCTTPLRNGI